MAMPARYGSSAAPGSAQLQPTPSKFPFTEAMTAFFARALGAARSGDLPRSQKDVERIVHCGDELKARRSE